MKEIEEWTADEEKVKTLDKATVEGLLAGWLSGFEIAQPSQFFKDHPTNDAELVCSI